MDLRKRSNVLKGKVRDKVKRVLLIDGTPSALYYKKEKTLYTLEIGAEKFKIGDIGERLSKELENHYIVLKRTSVRDVPKPIEIKSIGHRTTIRKVNGNTHITIGGSDEAQLNERIQLVKEFLESKGVKITERCHWVCDIDSKPVTSTTITGNAIPIKDIDISVVASAAVASSLCMKSTDPRLTKKRKELREMTIRMGII